MDYMLDSSDGRGGGATARDVRVGPRSRSPPGTGLAADVQMGEANDGQLREVVSGLDAMDLDNLDNVDRALALLTAKKEWIIAKQHAKQAQHQAHAAVIVSPQQQQQQQQQLPLQQQQQPPPPQSSGGSSSSRAGSGTRQRRLSSRSSRHGGGGSEGSPSTGSRSEAFVVSGGGGVRGAPTVYSRGVTRAGQGRPPPVPGHLSASTAAMRRSSPGSIASLAELDSYLEHHHRRLVEQVIGNICIMDTSGRAVID